MISILTMHAHYLARLKPAAMSLCFLSTCLFQGATLASPILKCKIAQGGETINLEFAPVTDPYTVEPTDINGSFRFKAVVIGDEKQIAYINLYTYYQRGKQAVLLHEAHYPKPDAQRSAAPSSLTGLIRLYSPALERELQYDCTLVGVAP